MFKCYVNHFLPDGIDLQRHEDDVTDPEEKVQLHRVLAVKGELEQQGIVEGEVGIAVDHPEVKGELVKAPGECEAPVGAAVAASLAGELRQLCLIVVVPLACRRITITRHHRYVPESENKLPSLERILISSTFLTGVIEDRY